MPSAMTERPRVAVVCPGAGRVYRGYEKYAQDVARRLDATNSAQVMLFQGGPAAEPCERRVRSLSRYSSLTKASARAVRWHPTTLEHYSFGALSVPALRRFRPDVLIVSERILGEAYGRLRRTGLLRPRLILANGGSHSPPFQRFDRVHHLTPASRELALSCRTEPEDRHVFIPYGFDIEPRLNPLSATASRGLRTGLGLPVDRPIVLSVGNLDDSYKRMGHLIDEVAALPDPKPYLLLVGQVDAETADLRARASARLGPRRFSMTTVPPSEVRTYYRLADVFVLASEREAFGRVYVEALSHGLPCVVHDTPHTRWLLGAHGNYVDVRHLGSLARELERVLGSERTEDQRRERHDYAYAQFSWDSLWPAYLEMITCWPGSTRADA